MHSHTGTATGLLNLLSDVRGFEVSFTQIRKRTGAREWYLVACGADGELWRIQHRSLLEAAFMLNEAMNRAAA